MYLADRRSGLEFSDFLAITSPRQLLTFFIGIALSLLDVLRTIDDISARLMILSRKQSNKDCRVVCGPT